MFDIIDKTEYWRWLDHKLSSRSDHSLKGIQDAFIMSQLAKTRNKKIAEIGGGDSRVLPKLKKKGNHCVNIDKFEGVGQGPKDYNIMMKQIKSGIKITRTFLGDFSSHLKNNSFDVLFSISVIEHVPNEKVPAFFKDCYRILKPNGVMIHAIDLYLSDKPQNRERILLYLDSIKNAGFKFKTSPKINEYATFKCNYATNSDLTLYDWNKQVPSIKQLRSQSQSVSLKVYCLK